MPPDSPLNTLLELARESADEAARALGHCNRQREDAARQLTMLHDYRQDYLEKLQAAMQAGLPATDCRNYQRFITTLDAAIAQQTQVLSEADQQLAAGRGHWRATQRKVNAFTTLQTRAQAAYRQVLARREQRASDEFAARRFHDHGEALFA